LKVSGPVGVAALGLAAETTALRVTGCPKTLFTGVAVRPTVAPALRTPSVIDPDELGANIASPEYVAASECAPTTNELVEQESCPRAAAPEQITVAPSLITMLPVGVPTPEPSALTAAVTMTGCPNTTGFAEVVTDVVLAAGNTVTVDATEVLPRCAASPPYSAKRSWRPVDSVDVPHVA
jgi:hypothetical protein